MNKSSTNYTFLFVFILTAVVAVVLTGFRQMTADQAERNEDIFNKRAILLALEDHLPEGKKVNDLKDDEVISIFEGMEQYVIDSKGAKVEGMAVSSVNLTKEAKKSPEKQVQPFYIYEKDGKKFYILSIRGKGLWDDIWGSVVLQDDLSTIAGVAFDHKGETPGMGAEIKDNADFTRQFKGKQILDNGKYVSVYVRKGGAIDKLHEVDGITGATITGTGLSKMIYKGMEFYQPYLNTLKKQ